MVSQTSAQNKIENSLDSDWVFMDTPETWVNHKEKIEIREVGNDGFGTRRSINQPGFVSLPNASADEETQIRVLQAGVPVDQKPVLSLDGHKTTMIKPDSDPTSGERYLSQYEAKLSAIMSQDDFMRKKGNTIKVDIR